MPEVSGLEPGFTPTVQFWNPKSKYYTRPILEDGREKKYQPRSQTALFHLSEDPFLGKHEGYFERGGVIRVVQKIHHPH